MKRFFPYRVAVILCVISTIPPIAVASSPKSDGRKAWQFETKNGKRTIVDQGNARWKTYYPNGTTAESEELDRTPKYIEIRNIKNKNVQRLFDSYGTVQKIVGGPFRQFGKGKWLKGGYSPKGAVQFGPTDYKVRVVYFVPQDRKPTNNYQKKIEVVLSLISEVITRDLRSKGLKTGGPQFETNDGKVVVNLLNGEKNARDYNDLPNFDKGKHFNAVVDEINHRLGTVSDHIVIIFSETYEEGPSDRVWSGHVAMAAARPPNGGAAMITAWMLRDEFCATDVETQRRGFVDQTPIRGRTAIGHRGPNSPRSDFIEDGIGGILHELAHAFGLPHDARDAKVNIMGQGFRNLRWNVGPRRSSRQRATFSRENTWLLMSSRYLNPEINRRDNQRPKVTLDLKQAPRGGLSVTVTATDNNELRAIVFLDLSGNDRKMITGRRLKGKSQIVRQQLPASLLYDGKGEFQIIVIDNGGNYTKINRSTP